MASASSSRVSTILTVAGVTVIGGLLAYAVYFDYKRRNDVDFRKKLKKEKKRIDKGAAKAAEAYQVTPEHLREALKMISEEEIPKGSEEKEQYFMTQVGLGEQLALQGPAMYLPAALAFFRGLRVYPSPVELIMIYQKTVPPPVFNIIMQMTNMDVQRRVEGYYDYFPKKSMNVAVSERTDEQRRRILVATKDFEAGDVIYKEEPAVAVLDSDLQALGTHCTHCLRLIHKAMAIKTEGDSFEAIYCSKECQLKSKAESENFLFGLEAVLPPQMDNGSSVLTKDKRAAAQAAFREALKTHEGNSVLLLARFMARQITTETMKVVSGTPGSIPDVAEPQGEYNLTDHMDRLRYIDVTVPEGLHKLFQELLTITLPGLVEAMPEDRFPVYLGKMAYNAYGVCYSGGRDDRPVSDTRPEDKEYTRTPYGTARQIGSALYFVSSYLSHSCDPNARPSFSSGTADLHLVASRPIKQGEEITVAYVDVTKHEDETEKEARRRRRYALARGWRFKCECARCLADASEEHADEDLGDVGKDASKVESLVQRVENGDAAIPGFALD